MFIKRFLYYRRYKWLKRRFKNQSFSLICNNCIGGIIYNDLGLRFTSPTINLYFYAPDYINFVTNLKYFLSVELKETQSSRSFSEKPSYPIGLLDQVEIHFNHYADFQEAKEKWDERKNRINWNNLFIMGSDRDGCTDEIINKFCQLPYNKVFFTSKENIKNKDVIFISKYKNSSQVGDMIKDNKLWINYFDLVDWLNTGNVVKYRPLKVFMLNIITTLIQPQNQK